MRAPVKLRYALLPLAVVLSLSACDRLSEALPAKTSAKAAAPRQTLATVDGTVITDRDIAPLLAAGLDKANAVDRAINRAVAAHLAKKQYAAELDAMMQAVSAEVGANVFASNKMAELVKQVTDADVEARYKAYVKDADFNGYQLLFALYASEEEARAGRSGAMARSADALKLYQPLAADKDGKPLFVGRGDVPYNLGVFVAKLKEGEFTEPVLVRNGYVVVQVKQVKTNPKPALEALKEPLRKAIADEKMAALLAEARKNAQVSLK